MDAPLKETVVEKFNQIVRGTLVLMLGGAFCYAFVIQEDKVSVAEFVIVLGIGMNWWFNKKEDDKKPNGNGTVTTTATANPPTVTTETARG